METDGFQKFKFGNGRSLILNKFDRIKVFMPPRNVGGGFFMFNLRTFLYSWE